MAFLENFIGGAAGAGADMLADQRRSDIATSQAKSLADYHNELDLRRAQMMEAFKTNSADRQREAQGARVDAAAGKIAESSVTAKRGIISSNIADPSSWTPEQQAAVDQSLDIDRQKIAADPKTRTQAAINTGDISPKDAATMDSRAEIQQIKTDAYLQNVQAKLDMAKDKNDMAMMIANMRIAASGGGDNKEPANAKMIEYLVKNGTAREQATSMVLGDGSGKTKDPVGLAAQLASALIGKGIRVPKDAPAGTTAASYAMDVATQQIDAATRKFRPDGTTAPKPASAAGLPQGAKRPPLSSFQK